MIRRAWETAWGLAVLIWVLVGIWVQWKADVLVRWLRSLKEPSYSTWDVLVITGVWLACMLGVWWVEWQSGEEARQLFAEAIQASPDTVVTPVTSTAFDLQCSFLAEVDDAHTP